MEDPMSGITPRKVQYTIGCYSRGIFIVAMLLFLTAAGCTGSDSISTSGVPAAVATPSEPPELNGFVAASEILLTDKRLPFVLLDFNGQAVEGANVEAQLFKLHQNDSLIPVGSAEASFQEIKGIERGHEHADGSDHGHQEVKGIYLLEGFAFTETGIWEAHLSVSGSNISGAERAVLTFQVLAESITFAIGDTPPASLNSTASDVSDLVEITSLEPIVPGLYDLAVADALEGAKPFVVIFSTPAFCTSQTCGPVLDVAIQVREEYSDQVEFIHIEPWDLDKIRNEGQLELTAISREWRLPSEPWTFVIGSDNRVSARWEGLLTPDELSEALDAALQ
jgi:hypothetical protein